MYLHPNGQIPAYEWNFGDVNPPVHAWATYLIYRMEKVRRGVADTEYLKSNFSRLLMNFAWWLNRKDRLGRNLFEGRFLGLDNVGVFDRSAPLPTGEYLEQADRTAWMAFYSQTMLTIAMELALTDPSYERLRHQNSRNPARCQEATVSAFTMIKASARPDHHCRNVTQKSRSTLRSRGRVRFLLKTTSC